MYTVFEKLCITNKVTLYKVSKETKIPYSILSDWKNGKSVPKAEKIQKVADYFNVSMEYLMTGKEKEFEMYSELDKANKQVFWKRVIKEINVDEETHKISGFTLNI